MASDALLLDFVCILNLRRLVLMCLVSRKQLKRFIFLGIEVSVQQNCKA